MGCDGKNHENVNETKKQLNAEKISESNNCLRLRTDKCKS